MNRIAREFAIPTPAGEMRIAFRTMSMDQFFASVDAASGEVKLSKTMKDALAVLTSCVVWYEEPGKPRVVFSSQQEASAKLGGSALFDMLSPSGYMLAVQAFNSIHTADEAEAEAVVAAGKTHGVSQ